MSDALSADAMEKLLALNVGESIEAMTGATSFNGREARDGGADRY